MLGIARHAGLRIANNELQGRDAFGKLTKNIDAYRAAIYLFEDRRRAPA
jgi:hypothetical protein